MGSFYGCPLCKNIDYECEDMKWLLSIFIITIVAHSYSSESYKFNDNCRQAYTAIYNLKIVEARNIIENEKKQNPGNMIINYVEGTSLFVSSLISNDSKEFETNKPKIEHKINLLKSIKENNHFHYFCKAELYFQLAVLSAHYNNVYDAVKYAKLANSQYDKSLKNFPAFAPAKMGYGYLNVILGQVPDSYKWIIDLIGLNSDSNNGIKCLDAAYSYSTLKDTIWRKQNSFLISSLYNIYKRYGYSEDIYYNKYIAWMEGRNDPISTFIISSTLNKIGQTDKAIDVISKCRHQYINIGELNLILGKMKLQRLDKDAIIPLLNFVNNVESGSKKHKDAIQRMAWYYLINGNISQYNKLNKEVNGASITNISLLKARLLLDGGYISRAKDTLMKINVKELSKEDQTEFYYRLGRIDEKENNITKALLNYNNSINIGISTRYTASSALKAGNIYKNIKHDTKNAIKLYNMALKMKFKDSYNEIINDVEMELKTIQN